MKLCYDCASIIESKADICPYCGADTEAGLMPADPRHLTPGSYLNNSRYLIGRAVSSYENGVVYAAFDTYTQKRVAITEYFPEGVATRVPGKAAMRLFRGEGNEDRFINGLQSFVERSEKLAGETAPKGRDQVICCFQENNTAYTVAEPLRAGPTLERKSAHSWVYILLIGVIIACAVLAALTLLGVINFGESEQDEEPAASETVLLVPNLIGLTEEQARAQYPDWDIEYFGSAVSDELPIGCIMEQDPSFGEQAEPGAQIKITVNIGASEDGIVPFLYGMGIDQARELLIGYPVEVEYVYDLSLPIGCVASSQPSFGESVAPGEVITVTVSRGGLLSGVEIDWNGDEIGMIIGQGTLHLTYRLLPANIDASDVSVEWIVSDPAVASVSDGTLTAKSAGTTSVAILASAVNKDTGETVSFTDSRRLAVSGGNQPVYTPVPTVAPAPVNTLRPTNTPVSTIKPITTPGLSTPGPSAAPTPATQAPQTQEPATQQPATQEPATEAPETPAPTEETTPAPDRPTQTPGIAPVLPTMPVSKPTPTPGPIYTEPPDDF